MEITKDPTRIFTKQRVNELLSATIGQTLEAVDKAGLFKVHYGREKVEGIAGDLHNKISPVPSAKILPEFIQRIPIIVDVIGDAYSPVPSVIFQPASNARRAFKFNLGIF